MKGKKPFDIGEKVEVEIMSFPGGPHTQRTGTVEKYVGKEDKSDGRITPPQVEHKYYVCFNDGGVYAYESCMKKV